MTTTATLPGNSGCVTKYHNLSGLNNRYLLLAVLDAGSLRSRLGRTPFWPADGRLLTCAPMLERESQGKCSAVSSDKGTDPTMTSCNPNRHPKAPSPNPSRWKLGLQQTHFGGGDTNFSEPVTLVDIPQKQSVTVTLGHSPMEEERGFINPLLPCQALS